MKRPNLKTIKKQITNEEIIIFNEVLSKSTGVKGTKLVYAIARTINNLKPVVEALSIDSCIPKSKELKEYEQSLSDIAIKYSEGKTKMLNGREVYDFPWKDDNDSRRKQYEEEVLKLRDKYKTEIENRIKDENEYLAFLKEEFSEDINNYFYKVSYEDLETCDVPESLKFILPYIIND